MLTMLPSTIWNRACTLSLSTHLEVHDVAIGVCGGFALKGGHLEQELVRNDPERPPVTADTVVCGTVQTGQHLGCNVLWSTHW